MNKAGFMKDALILFVITLVSGCLLGGEAVCRGVKQYESVIGAMGGGEYGVLGQAGMSGGARRAAALGDSFEYRGGFEHQHRVLLVEGS